MRPQLPLLPLLVALAATFLAAAPLVGQAPSQIEVIVTQSGVGEPLQGATVRVVEDGPGGVTDAEGRVVLRGITASEVRLEISRIGFETVEVTISLPRSFPLRVALGVEPVELDGVEAEGRRRAAEIDVTQPFRRDVFHGGELARAELRGAEITDLLRTIPGVRVLPGRIEFVRAHMSIERGAASPLILLDGIRVPDALRITPLSMVQSIEALNPREATFRYGLSASGGAIEIWTRGKGPFRSDPNRDCLEC